MNTNTNQAITVNEQKCTVTGLYRIWVAFAVGALVFTYTRNWIALGIWLVLVPLSKWAYIQYFPHISRILGYGTTDDRIPASVTKAPVEVTFYSALGCPFCPIVLQRLHALQKEMGFKLATVDVSFNPQFLASQGIRSVPVVEASGKRIVGNATSEQLANLISLSQMSLGVS